MRLSFSRLRVALVSILSCLVLLLGMFTFTGTASAHTQSALDPQAPPRPFISVFRLGRVGGCLRVFVRGSNFTRNGAAELFAFGFRRLFFSRVSLSIFPRFVRVNFQGRFNTGTLICRVFVFPRPNIRFVCVQAENERFREFRERLSNLACVQV